MARTTSGGEPLLLAVDLSNTGIKLGLYPRDGKEKDTLRARWRVATVRDKTTDEYAALLMTLCAQAGLRAEDIADVIIASVVPPLTPVFQAAAEQYLKREALVVSHEMDLGIKLLVDNPGRPAPTAWLARSPRTGFTAGRYRHPVRHRDELRLRLIRWRLPGRSYRAGAGHLRRGAGARRLAALSGRADPAAARAGQEHHPQHAVGHHLRACRAGRGADRATAGGATWPASGEGDRARRPGEGHGWRLPQHRDCRYQPHPAWATHRLRQSTRRLTFQ